MSNPVTITAPEGLPFIEIVRDFDAPVDAVYRAYADPELVRQWVGPNGYETTVDTYRLETGGRWRYIQRNPAGDEFAFNGVFHRAVPNQEIVQTFEWEGLPEFVSIETMRFTSLGDGRSRVTGWSVFPSVESRDGMIDNGMEHGVVEGYERLDALLR
ncbi:SRPBCC family protein [Herbiconiux moechotypicola]|uniref:SRPBCC family protein n=1 Tax=Herbiconiux moechotypicola TaxID=637393 RepID=A0ABP5Q7B9_9MICO|nr:SRPBCC family protein [Herbiconiux moechotypicola]MCS5728675.1 SRPBCC family protein [Herbiconiux moechotypicola]